ncbi:flavin reductase family protein [Devosia sp. SL43]|uniref:flavin reductase family protein n=1 Tax=Devosia sp. SL43 TaxID=2806348 RepID=UPI001F274E4E|nr:flavin reductase family protein [Devosia sp. SL43]UJW85706.1 flavin reductase family protein [Devosia sp. SL43]
MNQHTHFDFADLNARQRYKLLIGTVIPRPIAFITTLSKDGRRNAGPFSFFNVLTHDPAIVAIGVENYDDGRMKDTSRNIRDTEEFTVHIVDDALAAQMEICAIKFGPDVDELAEAGLETVPGLAVKSPRIISAPAALECRRYMTLEVGKAREIILGEVLGIHIRADLVDPQNLHVDQMGMDAIGRMGGHSYARTRDQFDIKTLSVEEWEGRKRDVLLPETTG